MFKPLTWGWKNFLPSATLFSMRSTSSVANSSLKLVNKVAVVTGSTNGSKEVRSHRTDATPLYHFGSSYYPQGRYEVSFSELRGGIHLELEDKKYSKKGLSPRVNCHILSIFAYRIGFSIARRLAQDGAHVIISSRKQQNVDKAVDTLQREGLSVVGTVCHVGKAEDRERLVATALKHCGGVDFLVCTAGVNPFVGSTLGSSEQVWDKILSVNVKAPALLLSQLLPHMENRGQGSVVLVSSIAAYVPHAKLGAYNVSKTALLGLTKTLAVELAPKNIRVNCLVPGFIKTDFSQVVSTEKSFCSYTTGFWVLQQSQNQSYVESKPRVLQKSFHNPRTPSYSWESVTSFTHLLSPCRVGKPEECAGLVSFLCSPDASYITGENIVIAGFSPRL
ncbi:dehydrogenase/reductase SDR family member 2, mitochondrial-like [Marmota marmota marmota]|uniref:dehydrogenase/reductase SDR family member 2, mitochondrial-like n=1 Tax=Marmota marmota marmota TaxID=9994 RepID=UPI0020923043|nr:dehydrogenase/reductase SDR family member 2, mitochondrial-like [Marmota marmota marmota]